MDPVTTKLPNEKQILLRLGGARELVNVLREALQAQNQLLAEAAACAVVDQTLKAVTAALHGFNLLLPQPLPAERVNWRNLRARFVSVQADSAVLQQLEGAYRARSGWLWWLERKAEASAFAPLLHRDPEGGVVMLWRDPLDPTLGFEPVAPEVYCATVLEQAESLIREISRLAAKDAERFRQAARRQPGRIA